MKQILITLILWLVVATACTSHPTREESQKIEENLNMVLVDAFRYHADWFEGPFQLEVRSIKQGDYDGFGKYLADFKCTYKDGNNTIRMYGYGVFRESLNIESMNNHVGIVLDLVSVNGKTIEHEKSKYNLKPFYRKYQLHKHE